MYYNSCYIKAVGYVLGQCFFTQTELEEIERDTIRVFTSCMGYNKNMAKIFMMALSLSRVFQSPASLMFKAVNK
eukprot:9222949-Ditylum_brightwellii.AAC.1